MAFEESLKFAVDELKGEATAFKQADNVCLAHGVRWMIDQLIGRKFSKSYPTQRSLGTERSYKLWTTSSGEKRLRSCTES